jgi:predicted DNA-binding transcriptional regulator YafY
MGDVRADLVAAVRHRRVVRFTYRGLPRRVQPAVVGILNGVETLHAFQVGGSSRNGGLPQWRNFHLEDIAGLAVTTETFDNPPPGYGDPDFEQVAAAL